MIEPYAVGQRVYIDGRDPDASPPLTIRTIQIWDQPERRRVVGRLRHGTKVRVVERAFYEKEQRFYYRVQRWARLGWLPEVFLSSERADPIGDLVL